MAENYDLVVYKTSNHFYLIAGKTNLKLCFLVSGKKKKKKKKGRVSGEKKEC